MFERRGVLRPMSLVMAVLLSSASQRPGVLTSHADQVSAPVVTVAGVSGGASPSANKRGPFTIWIVGPTTIGENELGGWTPDYSGSPVGPLTIQWSGIVTSNDWNAPSMGVTQSGYLVLDITDGEGRHQSAQIYVTVQHCCM